MLITIHSSDDDAVNTEEKIWDLTQAINVKGVWFGCKYAVIAMRQVSDSFSMIAVSHPHLFASVLLLLHFAGSDWLADTCAEQGGPRSRPRHRRLCHQRRFLRRQNGSRDSTTSV